MVLRSAILGLLLAKPQSGYDIAGAFKSSMAYSWSAVHSQIYPELTRMEAAGLIEGRPGGTRRRRVYAVTESGRAALLEWLREEPDRTERNEPSLRLFMLWTLPTDEQLAYLDREADFHRRMIQELSPIDAFHQTSGVPNRYRLMLEWGFRFHRARLDWIAWAQNEIRAGRGPEVGFEEPGAGS